ncbi:MAG: hypothetical protein CL504_09625 [Actinobacteria bacterium]|nr:hypothetical protein [Actinomycetota bacterium]
MGGKDGSRPLFLVDGTFVPGVGGAGRAGGRAAGACMVFAVRLQQLRARLQFFLEFREKK